MNTPPDDCRAGFEQAFAGWCLDRATNGSDYKLGYIDYIWHGWQACWRHLKGEG